MTEQTILLILLFCALAATLGLYILKAAKQTAYRGDERWQTVQLKAGVLADATNWLLIFLLLGAAIFADGEATFTLNRIGTLYMIYFGFRNLVELAAVLFYDRQRIIGSEPCLCSTPGCRPWCRHPPGHPPA